MKTPSSYQTALNNIRALTPQVIKSIADVSAGDGHTIYKWEAYATAGMTPDLIAFFTKVFESDGSPKGSITSSKGFPLPALRGIYGLDVVTTIADAIGIPFYQAMGRGFRARAAYEAIGIWVNARIQPKQVNFDN